MTNNNSTTIANSSCISKEMRETIDIVFSECFKNGFRYSNAVEFSRLRRDIIVLMGEEAALNDDEIIEYIKARGTEYENKIYFIAKDTIDQICQLVEDYFKQGAEAIFYTEFYEKHEQWLFASSIVSEIMLKDVFQSNFKSLRFTLTYFGKSKDSIDKVLKREILRVWGSDVLVTYEELAERLIYIPQFRMENFLGQNIDFIWNSKGEYTHVSKIDIAEDECREISKYIESEIRAHGYASISDLPLNEIIDRNYKLSITAIHNAIYSICLADKYTEKEKFVTRKGEDINAFAIAKDYCRTHERCTLDDLQDFVFGLTGVNRHWIPLQAGYDVLVRINESTFVAERDIFFDKIAIDTAIEHFLNGDEYISLRSVTTFAMFPHCGKAWNLFLLESYCRRFSDDFRFECLAINSKNAGVIVRKNSQLSYADIMVDAVAKSDIPLIDDPIMNFLVENGYVSVRRYSKITELINQAKDIRNKLEKD